MEIPKILAILLVILAAGVGSCGNTFAAGGTLTLSLEDESTGESVIARTEFFRAAAAPGRSSRGGKPHSMPIRKTVSAGLGVVVDRSVILELPDGPYRFRIVRGPEYRVVGGTFELEKTSLDEKTVPLPRMVNMAEEGWISGDCCVVPSSTSLPLRMASEDLHVAAVMGERVAKPIPGRDAKDPIDFSPTWIRSDVTHHAGLVFYGVEDDTESKGADVSDSLGYLVSALNSGMTVRVGIENPFAWELPVWLASGKVDGFFVLGDWLRLDRRVLSVRNGRNEESFSLGDPTQVGRFAERIYRHALDAGIELVPLAGGGSESAKTPVGYNRLYVTENAANSSDEVDMPRQPVDADAWWRGVWSGHSVATNGPILRPLVGGKLPGHVFEGRSGEVLRIQPELNLAVRDPVDYLEVIHNNRVHYSARLDEFAKAGGRIPPILAEESGWVIIRVLTLHEEHYRAAVSAPWWIVFDGKRRVSKTSVEFFRNWLGQYEDRLKRLPGDEVNRYVPFILAARRFWDSRADVSE